MVDGKMFAAVSCLSLRDSATIHDVPVVARIALTNTSLFNTTIHLPIHTIILPKNPISLPESPFSSSQDASGNQQPASLFYEE